MADNGAHYHKCDFQVHSPRDRQWTGAECTAEVDRTVYASSLIEASRIKRLDAIAITDHHDMAFVPYVRKAALAETDSAGQPLPVDDRLIVFPGIELTLAVPCQAILILDADFEDNRFAAVLTALAINPAPDADSRTAETVRLENIQSLKGLKEKLDEHSWLKDRYTVLPNVSGEGKFSLLRNGMMAKYKEMPFVGGYVDGSLSSLKAGPRSILAGKDKNWGNKRIACIQTSDSRRENHANLGKWASWIKWAKPTAEALRQACLAQESRISHEEPKLPSAVVFSISVSNSGFLGPIDLSFNPQYNALIGGRGTGKSTILEYLRWALCDQPPITDDEDAPNYQSRRSRLIANTLKPLGATVDISFVVNEVLHLVRRDSKDGSLLIKIGGDEMRACTEAEVRSLLPIQAYSQKQLSDVSVRTEEMTRFITDPIRSELSHIDSKIKEKAEHLRQSYSTRLRQQALTSEITKRALEARSLQEQADSIRNSLSGLSDADRALLDQGKGFDAADERVEAWISDLRSLESGVSELSKKIALDLQQASPPPEAPEPEILLSAHSHYVRLLAEARGALDSISAQTRTAVDSKAGTPWAKWRDRLTAFRENYAAAVMRSSVHKERMEQLQAIEAKLAAHHRGTTRLNEERKTLKAASEAYEVERKAWHEARAERDALLHGQCQKLTESAGGAIRATIKRYANASSFVDRLRESLSRSNIRRERTEGLGAAIVGAENPHERWNRILEDLESLAAFDPDQEGVERRPDTPALAAAGLNPADLDRIARRLTADEWLALSLIEIKSEPVFEYRSRENEYIPFSNASAGQQATALLKTLLNQAGPPLLIDQPERIWTIQ